MKKKIALSYKGEKGEPYTEMIAFGGPYVMNFQQEIAQANSDYYNGKYGEIKYKSKINGLQ